MEFRPDEALLALARTPSVLEALVGSLPETWVHATEGGDSWSPYTIVGHLIHGEKTDWVPRARLILSAPGGEPPIFDPFDRFAQFSWAPRPLGELLLEFAELRRDNLATVKGWSLGPDQLALPGRHPDLGLVTLGQLLATWMVHDQSHIRQIARVLAKLYADGVGPWGAYLPVLAEPR
ncbi:MAG: DinB family protein [Gemmatimonadales bacterium]|nr:DinB family protein [Gemmatimonadales bacterium]